MSNAANFARRMQNLGESYESIVQFLCESSQDNIAANAGGGQANATRLVAMTNRVTVVASAGDSVMLPLSAPGLELMVINHGANALQVFGSAGETINDIGTSIGVSQMMNSVVIYTCSSAGQWYTEGLASGFSGGFQTVSFVNGLTAGATQTFAGGTPITAMIARFTTVAAVGNSGSLPVAAGGLAITVTNGGANSMGVYPSASDSINAAGVGTVYALAAGKTAQFTSASPGFWHAVLSA